MNLLPGHIQIVFNLNFPDVNPPRQNLYPKLLKPWLRIAGSYELFSEFITFNQNLKVGKYISILF